MIINFFIWSESENRYPTQVNSLKIIQNIAKHFEDGFNYDKIISMLTERQNIYECLWYVHFLLLRVVYKL